MSREILEEYGVDEEAWENGSIPVDPILYAEILSVKQELLAVMATAQRGIASLRKKRNKNRVEKICKYLTGRYRLDQLTGTNFRTIHKIIDSLATYSDDPEVAHFLQYIDYALEHLTGIEGEVGRGESLMYAHDPDNDWLTLPKELSDATIRKEILHELLGNPFRPVTWQPEWRTPTVIAIAQGIYDEQAFDRLPVMADALEDAGCDFLPLLQHCRDHTRWHMRGCFAVEGALGRN